MQVTPRLMGKEGASVPILKNTCLQAEFRSAFPGNTGSTEIEESCKAKGEDHVQEAPLSRMPAQSAHLEHLPGTQPKPGLGTHGAGQSLPSKNSMQGGIRQPETRLNSHKGTLPLG